MYILPLSLSGPNSAGDKFVAYFSYFTQKISFDFPHKLIPLNTICVKGQNLVSVKKIRTNISECRLRKVLTCMQSVNHLFSYIRCCNGVDLSDRF